MSSFFSLLLFSTLTCNVFTQNIQFPPLRSDPPIANQMVIPLSNRFLMRGSPVVNPPLRSVISVQPLPYQVLPKTESLPDDGETWHEGPLNTESRLAARLTWKAFEADINQRIENEMMWVPLRVLSGDGQVVSGVLYDLKVLAGTSNCSRYEVNAYTIQERNCVHFNGPKRAIFNIMITERSSTWNPFVPDWERIYSKLDREVSDNDDL
uniref:Cystatin n=2 Tax=Caenorhabditis japonica TaxID=281687 RepID=A0A8R1E0X1_CAEJA